MNNKYTAFNTHIILYFILFAVLLVLTILSIYEKEVLVSLVFALLTWLPAFVFVISPLYVAFSEESLIIVYTLGQKEKIEWDKIRTISLEGSWLNKFSPDGFPHYVIAYPKKEKTPFYVVGELPRTRKITKLIKKYYKKNIIK